MNFLNTTLPATSGETLVFLVAVIALLGGLVTLIAPRTIMAATGLAPASDKNGALRQFGYSEIRGPLGGFYVGVALYIILSTPRPYIILTLAFGFACFGRILAFIFDRVRNIQHVGAIVGDAILSTIPFIYLQGGFRWLEPVLGW